MKQRFSILFFLIVIILFSGCNLGDEFKFNVNKFDDKPDYKTTNQSIKTIEQETFNQTIYDNVKENQVPKYHDISYIAKAKNYSYPIKIAIVEFALPNTSYVSYNDMHFVDIVNNEKHSMNFLSYDENDITNTHLGYMKHLDYEIATTQEFYGINTSYLKFEDFYTHSFKYTENYFQNEYKRITGIDKDIIKIETFGPYEIDSIITRSRRANTSQTRDFKLQFEEPLMKTGINFSDYDIISIVFFDDLRLDYKTFSSFADVIDSKLYINFLANQGNIEDGLQAFVHELTHALGASDKYNTNQMIAAECLDVGLPLPGEFVGDVACLMCGSFKINETAMLTPNYLSEVKICKKSAEEIGWG